MGSLKLKLALLIKFSSLTQLIFQRIYDWNIEIKKKKTHATIEIVNRWNLMM